MCAPCVLSLTRPFFPNVLCYQAIPIVYCIKMTPSIKTITIISISPGSGSQQAQLASLAWCLHTAADPGAGAAGPPWHLSLSLSGLFLWSLV